ncbi:MAG TPA: bestrophin family ion channel, partial [Gemmata sp.]|nr:bestrophin family ion channel [Gemmata sp.]
MPEETLRAVRTVFRFPVLARLWRYIVAVGIYSSLVVFLTGEWIVIEPGMVPRDHTGEAVMAGIVFGWLLSFRTQTAYARWWDGRSLWGQLVNDSRNLFLKSAQYISDPAEREALAAGVVRFAEVLRDRLRLPRGSAGKHLP